MRLHEDCMYASVFVGVLYARNNLTVHVKQKSGTRNRARFENIFSKLLNLYVVNIGHIHMNTEQNRTEQQFIRRKLYSI